MARYQRVFFLCLSNRNIVQFIDWISFPVDRSNRKKPGYSRVLLDITLWKKVVDSHSFTLACESDFVITTKSLLKITPLNVPVNSNTHTMIKFRYFRVIMMFVQLSFGC